MCLCLLLIVIDREKECLSLHPFPNLSFRSSFAHPIVIGTDLQRIYNGTTWDGLQIAWKATLWVTEAHTRRRRGCHRIEAAAAIFTSLEGCTWLVRISPFIMYCLPGSWKIVGLIPAHPRFTRMYGVTNRTVFQTVQNLRRMISLICKLLKAANGL